MRKINFHENGSVPVNNRNTQISSFYNKPSPGSLQFFPRNIYIKPGSHMFSKLKNISAFFLWLFMFLIPAGFMLAQGQSFSITGRVVGAENQLPITGVSVTIKGIRGGTTTDANGNFKLDAKSSTATLVFSHAGYESSEQPVNNRAVINVSLAANAKSLDDVVVIGYSSVKRKDLTGSVSSVSAKQLKDYPLASAADAIQGRLAGVQVTSAEGAPGSDVIVRVRGGGSITQDNSPLYIVDGVQVENALSVLSPQDIASVDVLKDASTTAIYGARGANGVVIITTKSGKSGKTLVSYNGAFGFRQLSKFQDVLNPYDFVLWQYERTRGSSTDSSSFAKTYGSTWDTLSIIKTRLL
jgi:TonB-dependent SusC/RagA subfamily outer membrane receptor